MSSKRVGVDFHGVINHDPVFFREFCSTVINEGDELFVISGGPREYITKYLAEKNIPYTHLWCILDKCIQDKTVKFYADGSFFVDHSIWNEAKGKYCRKNKIGLHIDDSDIYGLSFMTPFCLYKSDTKEFVLNKSCISSTEGAQNVYRKLIEYYR